MSYMVANRQQILARQRRDLEDSDTESDQHSMDSESEHEDEERNQPFQTFPVFGSVIKQDGDLTCGMRCLQNMYGAHIVTRTEMDNHAKHLESKSFGVALYNPQYGDYSIEVLKDVLQEKGKWAQRIDMQKISAGYFVPAVESNPTFAGFIVAFDGHYVTVKYADGVYKCIDSLRGVETRVISRETLFQRRDSGIFCSQETDDRRQVVALLAVGGSPFVEYTIMHAAWSGDISPERYRQSINRVLHPTLKKTLARARAQGNQTIVAWYQNWKQRRLQPSDECVQYLSNYLRELISDEKTIIVKMDEHQAAIRCSSMQGLINGLVDMQWISTGTPFYFQAAACLIKDGQGDEPDIDSNGSLGEYGITESTPITLLTRAPMPNQVNVGGVYTFKCTIEGTCIGQQQNAYSVRDRTGKVHILYKHCIETITE